MKIKFFILFCSVFLQSFTLPDQIENAELLPSVTKGSNPWHPYIKTGVVLIVPIVGAGLQYRFNQYGFDFSASVGRFEGNQTLVSSKLFFNYWSVAHPGSYYGIGIGGHSLKGSGILEHGVGLVSLEQVVGYEWSKDRKASFFLQLELSEGLIDEKITPPLPSVSCGVRF